MSMPSRFAGPAVAVVAAAAAAAPFALELPAAPACSGLVVLTLLGAALRDGAALRRLRRDVAAKATACALLADLARTAPPDAVRLRDARQIELARAALEGGFPHSAAEEACVVARRSRIPSEVRLGLLRSVIDRHTEHERSRAPRRSSFDLVFVSYLGPRGDDTSAHLAEIRACRDRGLTIGLLHHPVYRRDPNPPLDPRVAGLVDGSSVRMIGPDEEVVCELAVVRFPEALMRPLERRPAITAAATVVVADRTPFECHGPDGPREPAWDVAAVAGGVEAWLGRHTWYAASPLVRVALLEHHAEEAAGVDLAPVPWNETVDARRPSGRRRPDGRVRIGRHGHDRRRDWPADPETLLHCYPDRDPFDIRVLGGADVPDRILIGLPANWTVIPSGSAEAEDFLAEIDLLVHFVAADAEAPSGRAPLEAMAAGVPVIADRRFEAAFGPAAVYCEPHEVAAVAERLAGDAEAYDAQRAAGLAHVAEHCSGHALMERLSSHAPAGSRIRVAAGRDPRPAGAAEHESVHKAQFIGDFVKEREVADVVDWGCGDQDVLDRLDLHGIEYTGVVSSESAAERMRRRFAGRPGHAFTLPHGWERWERRELALSLGPLPRSVDGAEHDDHLERLFGSSRRFVLIDTAAGRAEPEVRPSSITWRIAERFPEWEPARTPATEGSASLLLYEKVR